MINYIIQVMLFQILFLAVYDLFLSKETFFQKNRFYLLATPILSFLLPFLKIPTFQKVVTANESIIFLPEIVVSPQRVIEQATWYKSINYFELIFWFGVLIFTIIFIVKLFKIIHLISKYDKEKRTFFQLIFLPNKTKAFSFFNYIFIGKEIPKLQQEKIIEHEIVHSKQKHSADLLLFEFLKIAMWFNPILYFYQRRIAILHEYVADDFATKNEQKSAYINTLLSEVFAVENISFINQFYKHSFLKKRIIMMTKEKSKHVKQLKYLLLIPVLASMLFYTSCSDSEIVEQTESKKEFSTLYSKLGKNDMKSYKGKKETYLDFYVGTEAPKWKEINFSDLSSEEQLEYQEVISKRKDDEYSFITVIGEKIYRGENGRNVIAQIFNFPKTETRKEIRKVKLGEDVPFSIIEKSPTFPGCETGDKVCFSDMIKKHFTKNFNHKLPNSLGLVSGRKKVYVGFTVNKEGDIVDIKARAPHIKIKEEVIRIMETLPKMIPGEQRGIKVGVKYSIPFVIVVD